MSLGYEIDFLPVGTEKSGDAIVLRFGDFYGPQPWQFVAVIDGGFSTNGDAIVDHIRTYYGTDRVNLVVSTHPDGDHVGGLETVLSQCQVDQLWMHRPWNHTGGLASFFRDGRVTDASVRESLRKSLDSARDLEQLALRKSIQISEPFAGLCDATKSLYVVGPTQAFYEDLLPGFRGTPEPKVAPPGMVERAFQAVKEAIRQVAESWDIETLDDSGETTAENNSSAILLLALDGESEWALLTSDAGAPALTSALDWLAQSNVNLGRIKFIQVPHHGSQRNVGPTLLNRLLGPKGRATDPPTRSAFVSVAPGSAPKHPSKKVLNAFRRRGTPVHMTLSETKCHRYNTPGRPNWSTSNPAPFYEIVEE